MGDPPAAAARKPCCVCDAPAGKQCTLCKSRHYCSKACQVVDWKGGHKAACRQLAAEFQDRMLDATMPEKLKIEEEPAVVAPAAGSTAAARLPAARTATTAVVKARAPNDAVPNWRGTCAICLDLLPVEAERQSFYSCCCRIICTDCSNKCREYYNRCPLCRAPPYKSDAEQLRRLQKHVDEENAEAQVQLGDSYLQGRLGLTKSAKRALELYAPAAARSHAKAQGALGLFYEHGYGVKINYKTAAQWYRRAAEQGYPEAQFKLATLFYDGKGVAQSHAEAVRWYRLAAAQGHAEAHFKLGWCYANGNGVPQDNAEPLRCFKRAAAHGHADAAAMVQSYEKSVGRSK